MDSFLIPSKEESDAADAVKDPMSRLEDLKKKSRHIAEYRRHELPAQP
jgi:hypothetical protein